MNRTGLSGSGEEGSQRVAGAAARLRAFAWDYLVILGYLLLLLVLGLFMTLGPLSGAWGTFMSDPIRADAAAFAMAVLPVALYFTFSEASGAGATWGKRRVGLVVVALGTATGVGLGRALIRNGIKFLPWQLAHTAMFHIPGFPMDPHDAPGWTTVVLVAAWSLVAVYLMGLTRPGGRLPLYDRLAGTAVVPAGGRMESSPA
ncbi:MAG: RDD family protein [Gemmatimonadales bacterium]|jgi:uncharacterized RDD family membrane protein YckC